MSRTDPPGQEETMPHTVDRWIVGPDTADGTIRRYDDGLGYTGVAIICCASEVEHAERLVRLANAAPELVACLREILAWTAPGNNRDTGHHNEPSSQAVVSSVHDAARALLARVEEG